jgi:CubicO group peptidase (beta-lactamase class C family)
MGFEYAAWRSRLQELCRLHEVPGACLAIAVDGEVHEMAVGVSDLSTGAAMTTDAVFQIGSITKVYTATVVMQLVAEGLVALDTPVCDVLPEFRLADARATGAVTVGHLLSHTSGMENGTFPDVGDGDDCLRRYLEEGAGFGQLHPVGALGAYCHVGFVVAGALVERLTGKVWEDAAREYLLDPLELRRTAVRPDLADAALRVPGHRDRGPGLPRVPLLWDTPRAMGPGSGFCASAGDMVRFAQVHAADGGSVLSADAVKTMRVPRAPIPCAWSRGHRGLGWRLYPYGDTLTYGHGGELPGQLSYLFVIENPRIVIALCSNGGDGLGLRTDVRDDLAALAGMSVPRYAAPEQPPQVDVTPWLGAYRSSPAEARVEQDDTGVWLRPRFESAASTLQPRAARLVPVSEVLFAGYESDGRYPIPVTFHHLADGSRYLYARERTLRKIS